MHIQRILNSKISHYLFSLIVIVSTAIVCIPLAKTHNYHVVSFILLFAVSLLSTFLKIGPVLFASTLSALLWNFYFIPPHYTFHIEKTEDILIFGLFFIVAFVNGILTTRVRKQKALADEREKRTHALFQLTRALSKASGLDEVLKVANEEIKKHFKITSFFILQDGNNILHSSIYGNVHKPLTKSDFSNAQWVFKYVKKNKAEKQEQYPSEYTFFALHGTRLNPGVIGISNKIMFTDDQISYWIAFIAQISNALEREFLAEIAQKVRFLDESDRLYKTLFNSISHEFRIPVATIMGASDSIINASKSKEVQVALCHEIFTASLRLNRLIENLLNISRLESGHISVRLNWYDINDLINKIILDLRDELSIFSVKIVIPDDMPLIKIDFGLMEQVLYNLVFNATQHAPESSEIQIEAYHDNKNLILELMDNGPGFPEEEIKKVFNKFYRIDDTKTGGLGLGLSIVKGFIEAHNGTITIKNRILGGALFTIKIPSELPNI